MLTIESLQKIDPTQELKMLGLSDEEIEVLNKEIDGIIERVFDTYFSNLYE